MQCFTTWSLAQLSSSSTAFLSPEDAARRFYFHCFLVCVNTFASGHSLRYDC